ncbi:hypothetical protein [Pseudonocardia sp. WMMC193]|uniref:hypothetical protein n=1 Tax=Pseudonocardia sp. WMMC193 TaxID=2911965 RepID=UPI001F47CC6F|nr:hypothetical protein [Pseudonocardia sp. WMMC193]MCF7553593.1 hypothetical protein [Pseudonocardia sp. WMMC193]
MRRALLSMGFLLVLAGCGTPGQEPARILSPVTAPTAPAAEATAATAPSAASAPPRAASAPPSTTPQAPAGQRPIGPGPTRPPAATKAPDTPAAHPNPGPAEAADTPADQVNVEDTCPQTPCGPTPRELIDASDGPRRIPESGWVWDDHEVPAFDENGYPVGGRPWMT